MDANSGFLNLLNSSSVPTENPENFSQPHHSFNFLNHHDSQSYLASQKTPEGFNENASNDEEERTGRRLQWTEEDNIRLISAWLNNSVDPIDGNSKKGDIYWKQVATEYNKNSPIDRKRKTMNCKDHWGRMNRKIVQFNGIWCRLKHVYVSGQSDDQLMEKAHIVYKKEAGHCFTLVYLWREVRNQPKWNRTYVEESKTKNNDTVTVQIEAETRPEGTKAAKAKAKAVADSSLGSLSHDDIQLYYETQALRASTAEKMAEVQLRLSKDKLEAAQAREREAITKSEKAIMDKYTELLMADTTCLTDLQRMEHGRALQYFRDKLFGGCNNN